MNWDPVLIWFLAGLAMILSEFMLPGFVLVFFGIGAWITAISTWLGLTPGWTSQLLTFAITSVVLLIPLRRWCRARFFGYVGADQDPAVNLDDLAGHEVLVMEDLQPGEIGKVEYKGATWQARTETALSAGSQAIIIRADGIILTVRPRA